MARSLNKVTLIGNLTRDPEMRYTPQGTAVCTFSVATNRQWKTDSGDTKEDAEFHRIVAWDKLAEICSQMLSKGKKVYVEGRLQTRKWEGQDGNTRYTTEVVISEMLLLDKASDGSDASYDDESQDIPDDFEEEMEKGKSSKSSSKAKAQKNDNEEAEDEDIPF